MEFEFTVDKKIFEKENFRIYRVFSNSESVKHMINPIYGNVSIKGQMPSLRSGIVYVGNIKSTQKNQYGYTIETSAVMPRDFNSNAVNTDKDMKDFISFFVGGGTADKFTDINGLCKAVKEEDVEFLKKTKGIGDHTANKIINTFKKEAVDSKFLLEFKKWGFTDNEIKRLKRDYENNLMIAYEDIKKNIFKLVFKGYQLPRMDKIYLEQLDGTKDNPNRIKAYIVKNFENCLFEDFKSFILIDDFKRLPVVDNIVTSIGQEKFNKYLKELIREEKLYIINDKYISTHSIVTTDTNLYYELKRLIGKSNKLNVDYDIDEELKKEQEKYGVTLNEDQYNAVKSIIQNKVTLLTGGGGCGKTFCVRMAISLLERLEQPFDSTLVCLSGKASSVLQKSTHHEASTIHRALGFGGGDGFRFNSCNKFRTDLTLCDEVSMVSDSIMNSLLQAVSTNNRVVFVGDEHQLTAIGQSNPISDLSKLPLNKVKLTKPMRQATRSGILLLATDIRNDKNPFVNEKYHTYGELQDMKVIISENKYDEMINNFVKDFDVNNKTDYSLLACTKKLTSKINIDVQEGLIKCGKIKKSDKFIEIFTDIKEDNKRKKMKIYPGDVLLICKNNYKVLSQEEYDNGEEFGSLFLYNGQTVIVDDIYDDAIRVEMNGEYYIIHENFYDTLSSGYSFSIHRSQGETIPHCYIYLDNSYVTREMLLCNEMLYTAVSRAKASCELYVEDYRLLTKAIRNREVNNRQTILELLIDGVIKPSLPDLSQ